jgi:thioredoxin-dependent peroxiredoxin
MTALPWFVAAIAVVGCARNPRLLAVGSTPQDVAGIDQHGVTHHLTEAIGRPAVVYFYPKDETPGCTKEACAFRDVWAKYQTAGVSVYGVSRDDQTSHARFASHHDLPFPLIADPQGDWGQAFGVRDFAGKYARTSFLLDSGGKVARVYPDEDPGVHARQLLADAAAVRALSSARP